MRNMSFALTSVQVLDQSKDVTRRLNWLHLRAGEIIQPVRKAMGLRRGEKIDKLGPPVRVLAVDREPLRAIAVDRGDLGWTETRREGFQGMHPDAFVLFFCDTHKGCRPDTVITRIEFSYDLLDGWQPMPSAPKDGSYVELLLRHLNWHYENPAARSMWQLVARAQWIDFNGGGWTWSGMSGTPIAWRPA